MSESNAGRKTIITEPVIGLLIEAFKDGLNITQACWHANIGRDAYYDRYNTDPEFADKIDRSRQFLSMNSRRQIAKSVLSGDIQTVKWLLERTNKDEFSTRQEVTGRKGQPLVQTLSPEDRTKLDDALRAKAEKEIPKDEADKSTDSGDGGTES